MTRIDINVPEVAGQTVTFRWTVDPPTPLYRRSAFVLRFPSSVTLELGGRNAIIEPC